MKKWISILCCLIFLYLWKKFGRISFKGLSSFRVQIDGRIVNMYIWNKNRISFGKISFSANITRIKYVYFLDKIHYICILIVFLRHDNYTSVVGRL